MKETFEHKYNIGDKVYYNLPESSQGIIIDITYSLSRGIQYEVSFGTSENDISYCKEFEILPHQIFN